LEAIPLYPGWGMRWIFYGFFSWESLGMSSWTYPDSGRVFWPLVFFPKRTCHWWKNIFSGYKEGGQSNQLILVVLSLVVFVASLHIFALWTYLLLYSFYKSAVLWIRH
jgi:hypothetical protein